MVPRVVLSGLLVALRLVDVLGWSICGTNEHHLDYKTISVVIQWYNLVDVIVICTPQGCQVLMGLI